MKYVESAVTFAEFPDEICLALSISNCPNGCKHCSEPWLLNDTGTEIMEEILDKLISENPGISMIGFMGDGKSHKDIVKFTNYIHSKYNLKVGIYSGQDLLDMDLLNCLDFYKCGSWRMPEGDENTWWKTNCGPLKFPFSNQLMFKRDGNKWINITYKFREKPINNLKKEIM